MITRRGFVAGCLGLLGLGQVVTKQDVHSHSDAILQHMVRPNRPRASKTEVIFKVVFVFPEGNTIEVAHCVVSQNANGYIQISIRPDDTIEQTGA